MNDQSKSQLFTVKDGTVAFGELAASRLGPQYRLPGSTIDQKYKIISLIGEGGMGAVYKVRHLMLNREVALKTFRYTNLDEVTRLRFQREAQAIAKLNHENVIRVFDFGLAEDGVPYYTMEYLQGESLADRIAVNGPLALDVAVKLFIKICQGLAVAHSKGIIHRDLKPSNIFLDMNQTANGEVETVKIVDFGIASMVVYELERQRLTTVGQVFGSPRYMSPEQSMGRVVSERSDIYSLGCTLFEALVGAPPYRGANAIETIMMHHTNELPSLGQAAGTNDFPEALERVVARMLAKSPAHRQANLDQVTRELSQLLLSLETFDSRALWSVPSEHSSGENCEEEEEEEEDDDTQKKRERIGIRTGTRYALLSMASFIAVLLLVAVLFKYSGDWLSRFQKDPPTRAITAQPKQSAIQVSLLSSAIEKGADGNDYVVYQFPKGSDFGSFQDGLTANSQIPASGTVKFRLMVPHLFKPNITFLQNPANFEVFQLNQLIGIELQYKDVHYSDFRIIRQLSRLTNLFSLNLNKTDVTDADLNELSNLTNLTILKLNRTTVQGAALAQIPWIRKVSTISFCRCAGASDLLAAIKGSRHTKILMLDGDKLSSADFKTIATLPNLEDLQVADNGMKTSDLASLVSLKKLKSISAKDLQITKGTIELLKAMTKNSLEYVRLSDRGLSLVDMDKIKKLFPGVRFFDMLSSRKQNEKSIFSDFEGVGESTGE